MENKFERIVTNFVRAGLCFGFSFGISARSLSFSSDQILQIRRKDTPGTVDMKKANYADNIDIVGKKIEEN